MMKDRGDEKRVPESRVIPNYSNSPGILQIYGNENPNRITSILIVSTVYDHFLLEEEGRLTEHLRSVYIGSGSFFIPFIHHVRTGKEALDILEQRSFDMVVMFNPPGDMETCELSQKIKNIHPRTRIGLLGF